MGKRLTHLALSDDGFLFDTATGNTYTLNGTGTLILKKLIDGCDPVEVIAALCEVYDTNEEIVRKDLNHFTQYLRDLEILSPAEVAPGPP